MADAGFFKGTSAEQDSRFANKQKKLLKQMKFPDNIDVKIDMLKINLDILKPWITKRLQELLGIEDDVVIEFVFNQLEDKNPDPKMMQINLTGFLGGSKARLFIGELWKLLASAQSSSDGIPIELVEMKKKELLKRQEEDERLREIRKREEESHRQDIKPDFEKLNSGRNQMSSRNDNENVAGYKSRTSYEDNRRNRDRRRSIEKTHRSRESPQRRTEKQSTRTISKNINNENDRQTKTNSSSNRHRSPSKSPSHSRSPIKSTRKNESSSSAVVNNVSHQTIEKSPIRSSSSSSIDRSHKKTKKTKSISSVKEPVSSKTKKNKKSSKRTRSSSSSSSSSNSSFLSSVSSSETESKKHKKSKRVSSPVRNPKSDKKKDDHKSRKQSKSSSKKHHQSNDNKRKSHRDYPDKFKTKKLHRNDSTKTKTSILSSPKKPRLESQIRVQTPPPPPLPLPSSDDHKTEQQVVPIKSNRTERIVVLEESRNDSISTRVSITTTTATTTTNNNNNNDDDKDEYIKINNSSEDENEIDLRERLLREKAIKSMKRRQLSTNNNDINTKPTNDRIVYETQ